MSRDRRAVLTGVAASPGQAVGPVARMKGAVPVPPVDGPVEDPDVEAGKAQDALVAVAADLEKRAGAASDEARGVLLAQVEMARDPELLVLVSDLTLSGRPAARAVFEALNRYRELIAAAGGYLGERAADLDDVRDRAVARLFGLPMPGLPDPGHPFVLVARDLAPADTAALDPDRVLGFVTEEGGPTSHTAILARALGLPAVVACPSARDLVDDQVVLVDGVGGRVVPDPASEMVAEAEREWRRLTAARRTSVDAGPGRTADGHPVALLANVGGPRDVEAARMAGAEGVGLFRTEFLFLDRTDPPAVDEQERMYRDVLQAFPGGRVVIRVLDAGMDKPLPFLDGALDGDPNTDLGRYTEHNPALGVRGLRLLRLLRPDLLDAQAEAIARAAAGSPAETWVMAPMVATAEEAAWFAGRARREPIARTGVMIEVPAAALRADALLAEADFVSLGTNDLAQYLFAADRLSGRLAPYHDPWQPALLDLIAATGRAGRIRSRPVGVCGEGAADPLLALVLVGLGVTSLSMAAPAIPAVRECLARHPLDHCSHLAGLALSAATSAGAHAAVTAAAL